MFELHLTEKEIELLCEAIPAHIEAAKDSGNHGEIAQWLRLQEKLECAKSKEK